MMSISTAELTWQQIDGMDIPISMQFGDVYFSKDNGLLETRHVFLQGNDLAERLSQLNDKQCFNIGETGFGTGLNFLALWQLWRQVRPNNQSRVHFISIEKYPLQIDDLRRALAVWQELADLLQQLLEFYPLPLAGCHRLYFPNERISLDLWLGDAVDILPKIHTYRPINAWFLDGFAPARNPDFWQDNILKHIIRLSAVGTTFASFTVAGVVKRGLAQFGINITRSKGFGHKREMLKAKWLDHTREYPQIVSRTMQNIAVIGAGIAGLSCAWMLAKRGYQVDIYDKNQPLSGASGNPLALLNPKLSAIEQIDEHLMVNSWQYALRYYAQFSAFRHLTVQQLQLKDETELHYLADYPSGLLSDDVLYPQFNQDHPQLNLSIAGAVQPHELAKQILNHKNINFYQANIDKIDELPAGDVYLSFKHQQKKYSAVIVCCAKATSDLIQPFPFLKSIRGQVSWCELSALNVHDAYSYGGYFVQLNEKQALFGASFYPDRNDNDVQLTDHKHNRQLIERVLPKLAEQLPEISTWQGRASLRAQTSDYFPIVGRVKQEQEIYSLTGLGSKGFLFAPLCAEILIAELLGEICPVPQSLLAKLTVKRFKIMR